MDSPADNPNSVQSNIDSSSENKPQITVGDPQTIDEEREESATKTKPFTFK